MNIKPPETLYSIDLERYHQQVSSLESAFVNLVERLLLQGSVIFRLSGKLLREELPAFLFEDMYAFRAKRFVRGNVYGDQICKNSFGEYLVKNTSLTLMQFVKLLKQSDSIEIKR